MTRKFVAVSILAACALCAVFGITMAASYAINERCTEQMAWNGNC